VSPHDLLDDQLGIHVDLNPIGLPVLDRLETFDKSVVFGLVVGHLAKPPVLRVQTHAPVVLDQDSGGSRAGVATRRSISSEPQYLQAITRIRPQFSHRTISSPLRSTCMPEDVTVTWQAWHWLRSTSATGGCTRTPR